MSPAIKEELSGSESEEQKYRRKCEQLRKRVSEVEGNNEIATLALSRTKAGIRRLRLEYSILLERLEERAAVIPNGINSFEEMAAPPIANVLGDSTNPSLSKLARNGVAKKNAKKPKSSLSTAIASSSGVKAQKVRDPDLPKRPTNAYLIFCELEKDRIKQENEIKNPGVANDLSKSMTEAWKNLDEEERKPYYKLYEDDRVRYQTEMLAYNQKKQINGDDSDDKRLYKKQKIDSDGVEAAEEDLRSEGTNEQNIDSEWDDQQMADDNTFSETTLAEQELHTDANGQQPTPQSANTEESTQAPSFTSEQNSGSSDQS